MKALFTERDAITPELRARIRKLDGAGRTAALEVMGIVIRDWAVEAFTDESKRVKAWKDKVDGTPATLQLSHQMIRQYRVEPTPRVVEIANAMEYSIYHQLGTKHMVDRPVLPVNDAGELPEQLKEDCSGALWDHLES